MIENQPLVSPKTDSEKLRFIEEGLLISKSMILCFEIQFSSHNGVRRNDDPTAVVRKLCCSVSGVTRKYWISFEKVRKTETHFVNASDNLHTQFNRILLKLIEIAYWPIIKS